MMKRILRLTILMFFLVSTLSLQAQKRYWVFFADKAGVDFDPYTYFNSNTIIKRQLRQIPLVQFSDLPLRNDYLGEILKITGNLGKTSRWFNAVAVSTDKQGLKKISKLPYVINIQDIITVSRESDENFRSEMDFGMDQLRENQINEFGVKYFEDMGIDGTGIRIAVFDGGFPGVDTSPMFESLRESGRIIATWDFVKNKEFVYDYASHGTSVLTCIAGKIGEKKFGLATGAEFLLARTEISREVFSEEENWLAAVEWADKNGADIISSSLGYTFKRYFPHEMDGKSTLVTRSANMAASKGMLVVNAAGNDGDKKWEVIGAPADADSVLSIGGISPDNFLHIKFSSYGPTFDGRMKPNLVAFGQVATSNKKKIKKEYGTSFSTPLVSGFAACVMQIHPEWNNMKVFNELEKSGHLYPYYDYAHGYGVPQASYFTLGEKSVAQTFQFQINDENLSIITEEDGTENNTWTDEDSVHILQWGEPAEENQIMPAIEDSFWTEENEDIEEMTIPAWSDENIMENRGFEPDSNFLYFRITRNEEQKIKRYAVVNMQFSREFNIPWNEIESGDRITVYFKGYVNSFEN